ncbi:MAG TPA: uroporphyrinogen decarboxylase [Actinomycetota bacterium]|nr:uroporphyrinogen decarboxylase [Actinomycetota bacterium]
MNDRFLRACRGEEVEAIPVWFMRQAGRSLPEYRALKDRHSILELCRDPELAAEVTLQPVRRLGVDAAILFSDIVVPLQGMGVALEIQPGVGPVIEKPVRTRSDVDRIEQLVPTDDVGFVLETIATLREELKVPLIGFAGAPFTLASYLIEGGPSRTHARTKALMQGDAETWNALMDVLATSVLSYLRAQVDAGAQALQLFDSWVGHLDPQTYKARVMPWVKQIFEGLRPLGVPTIHFGVGTGELLGNMSRTGADVMGVDWRVPLDAARTRIPPEMPVQGNLDPALCLAPWEVVASRARDVLERGGGRGHIFNLGHGVLPETDPDVLARLVDLVHSWEPRQDDGPR